MRYQCVDPKCKAIFSHPAKIIKTTIQPVGMDSVETQVCPVCHGIFFIEYDEPKPEISSVISVDLAQVDSYLAKGYVVHELYAKTATLKMLKTPILLTQLMQEAKDKADTEAQA